MAEIAHQVIAQEITAVETGDAYKLYGKDHAVQVVLNSGTATVVIEVSNDKTNWLTALTFTMVGGTPQGDGIVDRPWKWVRADVTALGTPSTDKVTVSVSSH